MQEVLIAGGLVAFGAVVQTALGFGMAIVAAPLLVMVCPEALPGPLIAMTLVQCALVLRHHLRRVELAALGPAMLGRIPGSLAGAWLLTVFSPRALSIGVGVVVLLAVLVSLSRVRLRPRPRTMFWAGALSGLLGTSTTVGGPPMALVMQHEEATYLRGNMAAFFVYASLISLLMLVLIGRFGASELLLSLYLTPWSVAGWYLGSRLPLAALQRWLRPAILLLCTLSAISAIAWAP